MTISKIYGEGLRSVLKYIDTANVSINILCLKFNFSFKGDTLYWFIPSGRIDLGLFIPRIVLWEIQYHGTPYDVDATLHIISGIKLTQDTTDGHSSWNEHQWAEDRALRLNKRGSNPTRPSGHNDRASHYCYSVEPSLFRRHFLLLYALLFFQAVFRLHLPLSKPIISQEALHAGSSSERFVPL